MNTLSGTDGVKAENQMTGLLTINADDWGRSERETDLIKKFADLGRINSASAMVFMKDSERATELARTTNVDIGLHLNFVEKFTNLADDHPLNCEIAKTSRSLRRGNMARLWFPWLQRSYDTLVKAQVAEFERLYGELPRRVDGHHHKHLAANALRAIRKYVPEGIFIRRHFTHGNGEFSLANRSYKRFIDDRLKKRYRIADGFFGLDGALKRGKLPFVFELSRRSHVELMTHPVLKIDQDYLLSEKCERDFSDLCLGPYGHTDTVGE